MKINDEERIAAAEALRERTKYPLGKSMQLMFSETLGLYRTNICWANPTKATETWANIVNYLADLIDPTCNMDVMTTGERADYECSEHIMRCLNCGAEFGYVLYGEDGDVSMDDKPNYCPHCGTRVVSDDD
jgi:DNA-directed RNA polymerase subunit RPC12/RpoP